MLFREFIAENIESEVELSYYIYNKRDQREFKTKIFSNEKEAKDWAYKNRATIWTILPTKK